MNPCKQIAQRNIPKIVFLSIINKSKKESRKHWRLCFPILLPPVKIRNLSARRLTIQIDLCTISHTITDAFIIRMHYKLCFLKQPDTNSYTTCGRPNIKVPSANQNVFVRVGCKWGVTSRSVTIIHSLNINRNIKFKTISSVTRLVRHYA